MLTAAICLLLAFAAAGMILSAAVARAPAGPGFYRMILLVAGGLLTIGLGVRLAGGASSLPPLGAAAPAWAWMVAATVVFGARARGDAPESFLWLHLAAAGAAAAVLLEPALHSTGGLGGWGAILYSVGLATVAPALGGVIFAMLLAHWYLVEPRMPIEPLQHVLLLFAGSEILKLVLLAGLLAVHGPVWSAGEGGLVRAFVMGNALFVGMRAILGNLAPLGMAWMTWKTVEIRSIQSATGILYAAVVFVLFGETISVYLSLATGQPY